MNAQLLLGLVAILTVIAASGPQAQTQEGFEVASIRRNVSGNQQGGGLAAAQPGGRYIGVGVTLRRMVEDAYGPGEVVGGPAWIDRDRFDVQARAAGDRTPAQIQLLLRSLLSERFKVVVHTETREVPVYALTVARSDGQLGRWLSESDPRCAEEARRYFPDAESATSVPCGDFRLRARSLTARAMTMSGLSARLSGRVDRPVLDRTGLVAAYDLELEWSSDVGLRQAPPGSGGADELRPDGVSLFTALQEQLGLRLDPTRGHVDVIVIDRAELPTPN